MCILQRFKNHVLNMFIELSMLDDSAKLHSQFGNEWIDGDPGGSRTIFVLNYKSNIRTEHIIEISLNYSSKIEYWRKFRPSYSILSCIHYRIHYLHAISGYQFHGF